MSPQALMNCCFAFMQNRYLCSFFMFDFEICLPKQQWFKLESQRLTLTLSFLKCESLSVCLKCHLWTPSGNQEITSTTLSDMLLMFNQGLNIELWSCTDPGNQCRLKMQSRVSFNLWPEATLWVRQPNICLFRNIPSWKSNLSIHCIFPVCFWDSRSCSLS